MTEYLLAGTDVSEKDMSTLRSILNMAHTTLGNNMQLKYTTKKRTHSQCYHPYIFLFFSESSSRSNRKLDLVACISKCC